MTWRRMMVSMKLLTWRRMMVSDGFQPDEVRPQTRPYLAGEVAVRDMS